MKTLLKAGMAADDALETLNAAAILREDGGFSTVDLVEVNLATGDGILYKWGGAPSYLLKEGGSTKIGTASLPPGLGVGGTHQPQQIRLSLGRGEVLVLTSDGIDGEVVEAVLRQGESLSAGDLAAEIVVRGCTEGEDDGTAAVLKLHSVSAL
jgi:stage II sporulation protein E